jgi:hypothetical protein
MKINAALAKTLLLVASTGMVLPMLAKPPAKPAPAPAQQEETAKADGEEPEPTIPGVSAPRANGGFIGIEIAGGGFKLSFYDKKKKQVDCDVARAAARWKPNYTIVQERSILNPSGDGKTLVSSDVRPPYNFKLHLTLLSEDDKAVESFTLDFRA